MAYIFPQGVIELCTGVPLSPDYRDVMYCQGETQAYSFISSYITTRFTNESYTRGENGTLRIASIATAIINCNYLVFQNVMTGGESKRFFAFITSVNYINNRCTEIEYVIDDFMTWFPALVLGECFVEREIPATDEIGEHLVPENLELGDYIIQSSEAYSMNDIRMVLCSSSLSDGSYPKDEDLQPQIYNRINGVSSPLLYAVFDPNSEADMQSLQDTLKAFNDGGYTENIISLQLLPSFLLENAFTAKTTSGLYFANDQQKVTRIESIDGYVPKNNKLFTYPYNFLMVSNHLGQTTEYHYEYFTGNDYEFSIIGVLFGNPTVLCAPNGYRGVLGVNIDEGIVVNNFPQCPTANDTYKAYMAQNRASNVTTILCALGTGVAGIAMAAAMPASVPAAMVSAMRLGTAISTGATIASTMAKVTDAQKLPKTISGLSLADTINVIRKTLQIDFYQMTIRSEMAQAIDNYFSAYGYACHKVKKPDITSRPTWNYVQTKGCILLGSAPAEAKRNIINAMDNGVRFWHSIQNIGNFQLPN